MRERYPKMVMSHREYYIRLFFRTITSKKFILGVLEALGLFLFAIMFYLMAVMFLIVFPDEPINKEFNQQENYQSYPSSYNPSKNSFKIHK